MAVEELEGRITVAGVETLDTTNRLRCTSPQHRPDSSTMAVLHTFQVHIHGMVDRPAVVATRAMTGLGQTTPGPGDRRVAVAEEAFTERDHTLQGEGK